MLRIRKGKTAAQCHTARTYSNREVGWRKGEKGSGGEKEGRKERNELIISIGAGMLCAPTELSKPKDGRTDLLWIYLLSPLWLLSWRLACGDHTLG